jgi:hypothetical protein
MPDRPKLNIIYDIFRDKPLTIIRSNRQYRFILLSIGYITLFQWSKLTPFDVVSGRMDRAEGDVRGALWRYTNRIGAGAMGMFRHWMNDKTTRHVTLTCRFLRRSETARL